MTLRDVIAAAITKRHLSQVEMARLLGVRKQNLNAILRGRKPLTAATLIVLDRVLALSLDYGALEVPDADADLPRPAGHA